MQGPPGDERGGTAARSCPSREPVNPGRPQACGRPGRWPGPPHRQAGQSVSLTHLITFGSLIVAAVHRAQRLPAAGHALGARRSGERVTGWTV